MLIYIVLITCLSIFIGFMIARLLGRQHKYVGTIVVLTDLETGKITYSLELNDNPEIIKTRKEVTFKIQIPDEESLSQVKHLL